MAILNKNIILSMYRTRCFYRLSAQWLIGGRKVKYRINFYLLFLPIVIIAFDVNVVRAQSSTAQEYQIKAAFLYRFSQYTEWPDYAFPDFSSPLVFGVVGPENLVTELKKIVRYRSVNGRQINVLRIDRDSAVQYLHLLFVARSEQRHMYYLLSQAEGYPVLLVTDSPHGLDAGSVINFVVEGNRVSFDISRIAAERQGLQLSAQLLKVARKVEERTSP